MLYFPAKLTLSKLSTFLHTIQHLSCNMLRKMDEKSNEFLGSSPPKAAYNALDVSIYRFSNAGPHFINCIVDP